MTDPRQHAARPAAEFPAADSLGVGFAGRGWVLEALDAWLSDPAGPRFFAIAGEPGSGKTTIAWHLASISNGVAEGEGASRCLAPSFLSAVYVCSPEDRKWLSPFAFSESLALQLANRYATFADELATRRGSAGIRMHVEQNVERVAAGGQAIGIYIRSLDLRGLNADDAFLIAVRQPLEALVRSAPEGKVVILVDGLDEAQRYEGTVNIVELLTQSADLPSEVRFVITSRPDGTVDAALDRAGVAYCRLSTAEGELRSQTDISCYIRGVLDRHAALSERLRVSPTDFAQALTRASAGNFLYVRYILTSLLDEPGPIDQGVLAHVPTGLAGAYRRLLERRVAAKTPAWRRQFGPVLGTLAVAQEPITSEFLGQVVPAARALMPEVLDSLTQFLRTDQMLPLSQRTYALYHRSLGEFLLSQDQAHLFWCPEQDQHTRIVRHYQPHRGKRTPDWAKQNWSTVDDYGLRHLPYHVVHGYDNGLSQLPALIGETFIRAKAARFGTERSVLPDLEEGLAAARVSADLSQVLYWAWLHVVTRDRAAEAVSPEALPLLVQTGRLTDAEELIDTLDADSPSSLDERERALRLLAVTLAKTGHIEDALRLAETFGQGATRSAVRSQIARYVASTDPRRAIDLAGAHDSSADRAALCGLLAGHNEFVTEAIRLADNWGPSLEAVALEVARHDVQHAQSIIESIQPYDEDCGGSTWTRTRDVALANLAIQLAASDHDHGVRLLSQLAGGAELARALVGIVGPLARHDLRRALELAQTHHAREDEQVAHINAERQSALIWALMLANIAVASGVTSLEREIRQRWTEGSTPPLPSTIHMDADILKRVDLLPLRNNAFARDVTRGALVDSLQVAQDWLGEPKYPADFIGAFAASMALFDLDAATKMMDSYARAHSQYAMNREEAQLQVARALARYDARAAASFVGTIPGYHRHLALVAITEIVARRDVPQALLILDNVSPVYARTRQALIDAILAQPASDDHRWDAALMKRIPSYAISNVFRAPLLQSVDAIAEELARVDFGRARQFAKRYEDLQRGIRVAEDGLAAAVARGAATRFPDEARLLVRNLAGLLRAGALLALARGQAGEERLATLRAAVNVSVAAPPGILERSEALADILTEMVPIDPREALTHAGAIQHGPSSRGVVDLAVRAIVAEYGQHHVRETVEALHMATLSYQDYGDRLNALRTLLRVLGASAADSVITALEAYDTELANRLELWHLAEVDPPRAMAMWRDADLENVGVPEVIGRAAVRYPEYAVQLYRSASRSGVLDLAESFARLAGHMARTDPERALTLVAGAATAGPDLAESEDESPLLPPIYLEYGQSGALRAIAGTLSAYDLPRALEIVRQITDDWVRSSAVEDLWRAACSRGFTRDADGLAYEIVQETETIETALARQHMYRTMFRDLAAARPAHPSLVTRLVLALWSGDRVNFLNYLPNLIHEACRADSSARLQLEDWIDHVERIAAV
jgi:hypothetical protein